MLTISFPRKKCSIVLVGRTRYNIVALWFPQVSHGRVSLLLPFCFVFNSDGPGDGIVLLRGRLQVNAFVFRTFQHFSLNTSPRFQSIEKWLHQVGVLGTVNV